MSCPFFVQKPSVCIRNYPEFVRINSLDDLIKIREQQIAVARYLSSRIQTELSNSLFLTGDTTRFNRKKKSAYDLLRGMNIKKDATRKILKNEERWIRVSPPLSIGKPPIALQLREVTLKGNYTAHYYRIQY
jgi:hypothetical protein